MASPFTFALQSFDADLRDVARLAEQANLGGIAVADHPGSTWSPFVALATAVPATTRLSLGTAVINCGVRQPLDIASDAATLQVVSGGRVVLGLGAGHTPTEWSQIGQHRPSPEGRMERFEEVVRCVIALLSGETVSLDGAHIKLHDAGLGMDLPSPPVLLVGGGNRRLVRLGCELADVVELSGIGRTLPDGHYHEPRWSAAQLDEAVAIFDASCVAAGRRPTLGALVQHIETTDDAEAVARRHRDSAAAVVPPELLPSVADMLDCPYTLIGTVEELVTKLYRLRERWGFTRFTVRSIETTAELIAALV